MNANNLKESMLALGTAQFGTSYGIKNKGSEINQVEANKILKNALKLGIDTIDTAKKYQNSERLIGNFGVSNFKIVTKIPAIPNNSYPDKWLTDQFNDSLLNLKLSNLYGILFHNTADLLSDIGPNLMNTASNIKNAGLVKKIGISVYHPMELNELYSKFKIDLIQLPLNLFDRRFEESGWLKRLHKDGVEIHIRSIFLQGLLLMSLEKIPKKFSNWQTHFEKYHAHLVSKKISPIEACLSYPMRIEEIDKIVVGVDSLEQLIEIVHYSKQKVIFEDTSFLQLNDENLINPKWWDNL